MAGTPATQAPALFCRATRTARLVLEGRSVQSDVSRHEVTIPQDSRQKVHIAPLLNRLGQQHPGSAIDVRRPVPYSEVPALVAALANCVEPSGREAARARLQAHFQAAIVCNELASALRTVGAAAQPRGTPAVPLAPRRPLAIDDVAPDVDFSTLEVMLLWAASTGSAAASGCQEHTSLGAHSHDGAAGDTDSEGLSVRFYAGTVHESGSATASGGQQNEGLAVRCYDGAAGDRAAGSSSASSSGSGRAYSVLLRCAPSSCCKWRATIRSYTLTTKGFYPKHATTVPRCGTVAPVKLGKLLLNNVLTFEDVQVQK